MVVNNFVVLYIGKFIFATLGAALSVHPVFPCTKLVEMIGNESYYSIFIISVSIFPYPLTSLDVLAG